MKKVFLSVALLGVLISSSCTTKSKKQKMNVIYILADDLGYGDLGCYGQKIIKTPNIDRLAEEGMLFTQHYSGCTVSALALLSNDGAAYGTYLYSGKSKSWY